MRRTATFLAATAVLLGATGCVDQATIARQLAERDAEMAKLRRENLEARARLAECKEALSDKPERAAAIAPPPPLSASPAAPAPAPEPAPPPSPAIAPAAVAPAPLALAPQNEEASYQSAVTKIQAKQAGPAREEFRQFLARFPSSKLRPNARFWLAEADFLEQRWGEARTGFLQVTGEFPTHSKAADALYKAALCSLEIGDKYTAIQQLNDVIAKFQGSSAAGFAQKKLAELKKRT